jgi:hypothetical protein
MSFSALIQQFKIEDSGHRLFVRQWITEVRTASHFYAFRHADKWGEFFVVGDFNGHDLIILEQHNHEVNSIGAFLRSYSLSQPWHFSVS